MEKSRRSFLSRIDFTPGLPTRLQAPSTTTRRNHFLQSLSIPFDCESSLWRAENINHRPCKSPATADRSARFVNNDLFLFSCAVSFCSTRRLFKSQRISLTRRKMLLQSRFLHCANQRWFHSARPPFTVRPRTTRFFFTWRQSIQQIVPLNPLRMRALDIWPTIDGQWPLWP